MKYVSTRNSQLAESSMNVIKQGISPEGGLFVPEKVPQLSEEDIKEMVNLSYQERARRILGLFLTDFTEKQLDHCIQSAYNANNFDTEKIAPIVKLDSGFFVQELWHGPTCAFKDMALQILPHFMTTSMRFTGEEKEIVILVATSGDTGKAALEGFKDVAGTHIVVFFPQEGVSPLQKLQMLTQEGANVHVAAVSGNFDDAQTGVKSIFMQQSLIQRMKEKGYIFSSANSINWGRLVPQIVYYFSAYLDLIKDRHLKEHETFNVVVPTGNFGNILAAYYAKAMGVPIHKLICASNENKVLTEFMQTGLYSRNREFFKTISPSMDILISSNLERLLYELAERDDEQVKKWMYELQSKGEYKVEGEPYQKLKEMFWAGYASEEQTLQSIREAYNQDNYIFDPHTAVGKSVYDDYVAQTGDHRAALLVSTASPYKFPADVLRAILGDESMHDKDEFMMLDILEDIDRNRKPDALAALRDKEVLHTLECSQDKMKQIVSEIFALDEVVK